MTLFPNILVFVGSRMKRIDHFILLQNSCWRIYLQLPTENEIKD